MECYCDDALCNDDDHVSRAKSKAEDELDSSPPTKTPLDNGFLMIVAAGVTAWFACL